MPLQPVIVLSRGNPRSEPSVAYLAENQAGAEHDAQGAHLIVRGCWFCCRWPEKIAKTSKKQAFLRGCVNQTVFSSSHIRGAFWTQVEPLMVTSPIGANSTVQALA